MAKIIVLNAPPGAGKDTIGKMVSYYAPEQPRMLAFKQPMFDIAKAILGAHRFKMFMAAYNDRSRKEQAHSFLMGMTCREFMIWISEDVIKPRFGSGYFGKMFAEMAEASEIPVICTDGGFPDEIIELVRRGHEVKVCRLHRSGYTFEGDSRDYIHISKGTLCGGYGEYDYILVNNDPMHTVNEIIRDHLAK